MDRQTVVRMMHHHNMLKAMGRLSKFGNSFSQAYTEAMIEQQIGKKYKPEKIAVMQSLSPEICHNIVTGKQTVLIRKIIPQLTPPYKVYLYCGEVGDALCPPALEPNLCKEQWELRKWTQIGNRDWVNGRVIGEYTVYSVNDYTAEFCDPKEKVYEDIRQNLWNADDEDYETHIITSSDRDDPNDCHLLKCGCMTFDELRDYVGINFHTTHFYGLEIGDVWRYTTPKQLNEFTSVCNSYPNCSHCNGKCTNGVRVTKVRPNYRYVEELKND